jgi:small conductance mechanosensitive channel
MNQIETYLLPMALSIGMKLLGAIALWVGGRFVIGLLQKAVRRALVLNPMDPTIKMWIGAIVSIGLNIFLVIAILNVFGIETTSLAALVAAAGLAIGAAWSGLLANFAAGVFLILFKPFKVGDVVTVNGITGTVLEIGVFATTINSTEHVRTIIGNNAVSTAIIQNYSANPYRAVEMRAQLPATLEPDSAITLLRTTLLAIPNVCAEPAPTLEMIEFSEAGPKLIVRPYCHHDHYWQVIYDSQKAIAKAFSQAGLPQPIITLAPKAA